VVSTSLPADTRAPSSLDGRIGAVEGVRSSPRMRFSYQLLPEQPLDELLDTIQLLDQLGFWACYSADETGPA